MKTDIVRNLKQCERLWKTFVRPRNICDVWEVRCCFQKHFQWEPWFLILKDSKGIAGMLPLSYVADLDMFTLFPGEIWHQKTWMERTPIYVREEALLSDLLASCPDPACLRYLEVAKPCSIPGMETDEIGYVLYPPSFDCDIDLYYKRFSNKKIKSILKVVRSFSERPYALHFNRLNDFDYLEGLNLQRYGEDSYLYDPRLRAGFREMARFLQSEGLLHMVSIWIEGRPAAVDLGALYRGTYTVFLGGTDPEFAGIAKAINMHHIDFACNERLSKVDFLCGDFHWKRLWHLRAEPLFKFRTPSLLFDMPEESNMVVDFYHRDVMNIR